MQYSWLNLGNAFDKVNFEQKLKKDVMAKIVSKTKREIPWYYFIYPALNRSPGHILLPSDQQIKL